MGVGRIHSIETCGTVDGPGVRFVVFMQGCALKCLYCHNPDSRAYHEGTEITSEDLFAKIWSYRSFFKASGGGVTFSGGEPLLQSAFVNEMFEALGSVGIHTALDTSGHALLEHGSVKNAIDNSSLVLLDIKNFSKATYERLTGVHLEPTLKIAEYLAATGHPTWIRYVLVPGLTDHLDDIEGLAAFLAPMKNVEKVQVLPFHKMGEYKWKELGLTYQLAETQPPTPESIDRVHGVFKTHGLTVE